MGNIKIMDINLSNKIAAGEVVEKLLNVVKELVENAIDACATDIKINLIDSGIKQIKVIDNGKGMDREDATTCLERHATSKIYDDDDLFNITTLGFRGEALPSIASVSKMTIKTCNKEVGTLLTIEGGVIKEIANCDSKIGTTITVNDIFYNTPARLKYLKSLYSELANIVDYVNKIALAFPYIKFELLNNDKVLLTTDGSNNILKVINNIYGFSIAKKMMFIDNSNDDYIINGYISLPEVNRTTKTGINIMVNGRVIRNGEINRVLLDAYHTYLFKDKYPIIALNISTDPNLIDVNIHPTKMDIKFSKMDELKDLIYKTIKERLEKQVLIPIIEKETTLDINTSIRNISEQLLPPVKEEDKLYESLKTNYEIKEKEINYESIAFDLSISENKFSSINPLALVHGTYIIGENEEGLFIIDQHAANERVNYENYMEELGKVDNKVIDLLIPIKIELSNKEYLILKNNFDILNKIKIEYEDFGNNTIIIRSHPIWLKKGYEEEQLKKIIDIIVTKEEFSKDKYIEGIAINLACKTAIKANEHISLEEMRTLLDRLKATKNPYTCPHGRPTIIKYTIYELEKLFKRVA